MMSRQVMGHRRRRTIFMTLREGVTRRLWLGRTPVTRDVEDSRFQLRSRAPGGAGMKESGLVICGLCAAIVATSSCGGSPSDQKDTASSVKLQGAGASFPAPLYTRWFKTYSASHQNVLVDYQSVGSGSGVKSVIDHTVDFGASDAAMKPEDIAKVPE